ncbi:unnamed protein product [Phaeothamnion confervicola]
MATSRQVPREIGAPDGLTAFDDENSPASKLLRDLGLSPQDARQLDILDLLLSLPRKERTKYGKRKNLTAEERVEQTKRRNREHARSTRKRKKLIMDALQAQVDMLHGRAGMAASRAAAAAAPARQQQQEQQAVEERPHGELDAARLACLRAFFSYCCSSAGNGGGRSDGPADMAAAVSSSDVRASSGNGCSCGGVSGEAPHSLEEWADILTEDFMLSLPALPLPQPAANGAGASGALLLSQEPRVGVGIDSLLRERAALPRTILDLVFAGEIDDASAAIGVGDKDMPGGGSSSNGSEASESDEDGSSIDGEAAAKGATARAQATAATAAPAEAAMAPAVQAAAVAAAANGIGAALLPAALPLPRPAVFAVESCAVRFELHADGVMCVGEKAMCTWTVHVTLASGGSCSGMDIRNVSIEGMAKCRFVPGSHRLAAADLRFDALGLCRGLEAATGRKIVRRALGPPGPLFAPLTPMAPPPPGVWTWAGPPPGAGAGHLAAGGGGALPASAPPPYHPHYGYPAPPPLHHPLYSAPRGPPHGTAMLAPPRPAVGWHTVP